MENFDYIEKNVIITSVSKWLLRFIKLIIFLKVAPQILENTEGV
jgi:hypothetical protein